jgi:hypothetical protein
LQLVLFSFASAQALSLTLASIAEACLPQHKRKVIQVWLWESCNAAVFLLLV